MTIVMSTTPGVFGKHYKLGKKIGSGSFGEIYEGFDLKNGFSVAIKVEAVSNKMPHLLFECKVYRSLQGVAAQQHIPRVYFYGVHEANNVMVMDLLGPSLEELISRNASRKFRLKTTLMLADQMLSRIEYVHSRHFLHRDIKPHNFLIGRNGLSSTVYIIDFGLAKRYRDPRTGAHMPYREGKSLTGTARYVSVNTHLGFEQGRRDDIEALGYVFLYFLKGHLPWQGIQALSKREKYEKIKKRKMELSVAELIEGAPKQLGHYITYARSLTFAEKPDYAYLRKIMSSISEILTPPPRHYHELSPQKSMLKLLQNAVDEEQPNK